MLPQNKQKKMKKTSLALSTLLLLAGAVVGKDINKDLNTKLKSISSHFIFADMHAHPSRFHRSNLDSISEEEINRYKLHNINVVVASISTDMAYEGNYDTKNGKVPRGKYKPSLGQSFALTFERFQRIQNTFTKGRAVHASSPSAICPKASSNFTDCCWANLMSRTWP